MELDGSLPNLQLTSNIARSSEMNFLKSELRYSKPFWNAKAMNENESADFDHFYPKLVAMATFLKQSERGSGR